MGSLGFLNEQAVQTSIVYKIKKKTLLYLLHCDPIGTSTREALLVSKYLQEKLLIAQL